MTHGGKLLPGCCNPSGVPKELESFFFQAFNVLKETFGFWEWKNKIWFKKEMLQHFRRMDLTMIYTLPFLSSKLHYMLSTCFILPNLYCYFYRFPYYLLPPHQICVHLQVRASPWRYDRWNFCSRSLQLFLQVSILLVHPATFSARFGWMHPILGPDFYTRGIRFHAGIISQYLMIIWHHMKGTSSNVSHFFDVLRFSFVEVPAKQHLSPAGQPCWTAPAEALGRPLAIPPRIFSVIFFFGSAFPSGDVYFKIPYSDLLQDDVDKSCFGIFTSCQKKHIYIYSIYTYMDMCHLQPSGVSRIIP